MLSRLNPAVVSGTFPDLLPDLLGVLDPSVLVNIADWSGDNLMSNLCFKARATEQAPVLGWITVEAVYWVKQIADHAL